MPKYSKEGWLFDSFTSWMSKNGLSFMAVKVETSTVRAVPDLILVTKGGPKLVELKQLRASGDVGAPILSAGHWTGAQRAFSVKACTISPGSAYTLVSVSRGGVPQSVLLVPGDNLEGLGGQSFPENDLRQRAVVVEAVQWKCVPGVSGAKVDWLWVYRKLAGVN